MSGSKGKFSFRMSADDAKGVVDVFRQLSTQSDEVKRAFDRLIQSSPQLASVNDNVQRKMRDTAEAMKKTGAAAKEAHTPMTSLGQSFGQSGLIGAGLAAGVEAFNSLKDAAIAAYEAIPLAGDAAKQAIARLSALTGSALGGQDAYTRIQEIASRTGSTIEQTVEAFQKFRVAAGDLGATSSEVLALIENIQKFAVVNGVAGQSLSAATTQLAQALASGKLSGDELKSILENMPQLAQSLAREMGVSVGRLREMGTEGKLTSEVVFPALQRAVAGVGEQFDKMPVSIGRARNEMDVAASKLLETLDNAFGLSGKVVAKFQQLAGIMNGIAAGVRAITQDERAFTLGQERGALREQVGAFDATIAEASALPNPDRDAIAHLVRRRDEMARILAAKDAEIERERRTASEAAHAATLARTGQQIQEIFDLDKTGAADRELAARKKVILERFTATGDAAEMDRATALAVKDHAEALAKLVPKAEGATRAIKDHTEATADFLKQRGQVEEAARAVELQLDPYAAAWEKAADQVQKLIEAMQLFEESGGARGMDPARGAELIVTAQQGLIDSLGRTKQAASAADNAFSQFFANATSSAEDAIIRFESVGDVLRGLTEDVARLLLRVGVTGPLSEGLSGLLKDQGGASGLLKSAGSWITSLFADGGIMTSAGPLPLRRYASGGIADSAQLAMFGEGSTPEAYVPLPDGRRIPVAMQGGGRGDTVVNVSVANSNASPALIGAVVAGAVRQAKSEIYGEADRGGAAAKKLGRRR